MPMAKEPPVQVTQHLITQQQENKPKQVFWDEQGRLLDEKGNLINLKQSSELKINQKNQKDSKDVGAKDLLKMKKFGQATQGEFLAKRKFFDPSIDNSNARRLRRKTSAFQFVQEGQFVKRGEILRKKQALEEYEKKEEAKVEPMMMEQTNEIQQEEEKETEKKNGESQISIRKTVNLKPLDPIPDLEWWDSFILHPADDDFQSNDILDRLNKDKMTHYVQHPVVIKNDYVENINKMIIPAHLTQKEKKRLRKMKRIEREKDKQERVKLGLLPPPKPKIKLSNYMKVMAKEAIADPSKVEMQVKKIVEQRQQEHLKRNEDNKLTRDQKEAKMKRKHDRDIQNNECRVALFKIDKLDQPHLKFKVDINAQQYHLGGFCFIADPHMAPSDLPNMILIEGGPRAIKKYKRLMLRRIKWNEKSKQKNHQDSDQHMDDDQIDNIKESLDKKCFLVWEGVVKKKNFEKWRVVDIRSENEAKRLLAERGCEHYWNMVVNFYPDRAQGDGPEQLDKVLL